MYETLPAIGMQKTVQWVKTKQIIEGLKGATIAVMINNDVYVTEYGATARNIWKIVLPE